MAKKIAVMEKIVALCKRRGFITEPIYREIRRRYPCQYDAKQTIGKRYARIDEAGTPFCFTIDGQTKEDGTVTVRNRDNATGTDP